MGKVGQSWIARLRATTTELARRGSGDGGARGKTPEGEARIHREPTQRTITARAVDTAGGSGEPGEDEGGVEGAAARTGGEDEEIDIKRGSIEGATARARGEGKECGIDGTMA